MAAAELGAALEVLARSTGEAFDAKTFESRLRIQKTVYLLAALGYRPVRSYSYNRYFHGPYSPDLAKDYYALVEKRAKPADRAEALPPSAVTSIVKAVRLGNPFLEAASTLHFVARQNRAGRGDSLQIVQGLKPHLRKDTLEDAWQWLRDAQLVAGST